MAVEKTRARKLDGWSRVAVEKRQARKMNGWSRVAVEKRQPRKSGWVVKGGSGENTGKKKWMGVQGWQWRKDKLEKKDGWSRVSNKLSSCPQWIGGVCRCRDVDFT